ncbi:hypothetical protein CIW66_14815 [Enterobacter cloacae]|nr:hypothetical protein APU11_14935 [Enterobacter sp. 50793107]KTH21371.1 hypothetical protein ASV29_18230 [Enterobacter cloacae subsp. cloacae]OZU92541.1 hypothetical protein CIW67_13755 [Enterobacter cloacae]KTH23528.1 hypothetical protein ASV28_02440 [Enterobacter cloacae subsp. cloacae]PAN83610.1 hypothetical protein CIW66_14815 [Enterobacter cloacae]
MRINAKFVFMEVLKHLTIIYQKRFIRRFQFHIIICTQLAIFVMERKVNGVLRFQSNNLYIHCSIIFIKMCGCMQSSMKKINVLYLCQILLDFAKGLANMKDSNYILTSMIY